MKLSLECNLFQNNNRGGYNVGDKTEKAASNEKEQYNMVRKNTLFWQKRCKPVGFCAHTCLTSYLMFFRSFSKVDQAIKVREMMANHF